MSKRLSEWSELLFSVVAQVKTENWHIAPLSSPRVSPIVVRGLLLFGILLFWYWNWKLLLATVVGIGIMLLVYLAQGHQWGKFWRMCNRWFNGYNRKLAIAVSTGGIGAFLTYLFASIWADTENRWLATGSILQGLGTLITLILLGYHLWGEQHQKQEHKFHELSQDLTVSDPLKRLMAIRQLTLLALGHKLPQKYYGWLIDYYHLMLSQSQEKLVREALLDGLESLDVSFTRESHKKPLPISLNLKRSPKPVPRSYF